MKKRGRNTLTTFAPNNLDVSKSLSTVKLSYEKDSNKIVRKKRPLGNGTNIYDHLNKTYNVLRSASASHVVRPERDGKPRGREKQQNYKKTHPEDLNIKTEMSDTEGSHTAGSDAEGNTKGGGSSGRSNPQRKEGDSAPFPYQMDPKVLAELQEAEQKAVNTGKLIDSMRESIAKYCQKENLTDDDEKILQLKKEELVEKMNEFESITKQVQNLIGLASVPSAELGEPSIALPLKMAETVEKAMNKLGRNEMERGPLKPSRDTSPDNRLPKVIICGANQAEVPKVIVCDAVNKIDNSPASLQQYLGESPRRGQPYAGEDERFGVQERMFDKSFEPPNSSTQQYPPQIPYEAGPQVQGWQVQNQGYSAGQPPYWSTMPSYPGNERLGFMHNMPPPGARADEGMLDQLTGRLDASYKLQEKLAHENAEMEGTRYQLQEELLNKDQTVENLQRQLESLQAEMRLVVNENTELKRKIDGDEVLYPKTPLCKMKLARDPICKRELAEQLSSGPCEDTKDMEYIVAGMENEVRAMQKELASVQQERKRLELQKKLLKCAGQHTATGGGAQLCRRQVTEGVSTASNPHLPQPAPPSPPPPPPPPLCALNLENQLKEMKEQYQRLQEDYNAKIGEISVLRVELESSKKEVMMSFEKVEEAEARADDLLDRLKVLENDKMKMVGSRDHLIELEQQVAMAKQRFREGQEELEEVKSLLQDQTAQAEDYRNKYLSAQEAVETQRRQIDIMELENNRLAEQVNLEIQRVKAQFQDKLQELTPLPEILKATQLRLQESQQLRSMLERNCEELSKELEELKDKNERLTEHLDEIRSNKNLTEAERTSLQISLTDGERKMEETKSENNKLKATIARLEELAIQNERRLEEKNHETLQLQNQLETLREESARQVSRTKERSENQKRNFQSQISELERQLAQSRSAARTAQKDRDEIRQKMQAQISQLNENFDQAQMRIRTLQSHVNYLKTSYTNIFSPDIMSGAADLGKVGGNAFIPIEPPTGPPPISSSIEAEF